MTSFDHESPQPPPEEPVYPFDLGTWLGRWQAFGFVANRCTAADIECLSQIRSRKLYRALTSTWDQFCSRYLGQSRSQIDRLLNYLDEFGPRYFYLSQIVRISPDTFRLIAPAVRPEGIVGNGLPIPLTPENAGQIRRAVRDLRRDTPRPRPSPTAAWEPRRATEVDQRKLQARLERLATQLLASIQRLAAFTNLGLPPKNQAFVLKTAEEGIHQLTALKRILRGRVGD